jgi:hypothetical protein
MENWMRCGPSNSLTQAVNLLKCGNQGRIGISGFRLRTYMGERGVDVGGGDCRSWRLTCNPMPRQKIRTVQHSGYSWSHDMFRTCSVCASQSDPQAWNPSWWRSGWLDQVSGDGVEQWLMQKRVKEQWFRRAWLAGRGKWVAQMGLGCRVVGGRVWNAACRSRCVTARATQTRTSKLPVPPRASTWNFHSL